MLKKAVFTSILLFSGQISAETYIDLYGDSAQNAERILKKYSYEIKQLVEDVDKVVSMANEQKQEKEFIKVTAKKKSLVEKIKKNEHYSFVDFQTIYYPTTKNYYLTVEVVRNDEKQRLHYVSPKINIQTNKTTKKDLIAKRIKFDELEMRLMYEHKVDPNNSVCPVYHCVTNFNHPNLKPYLAVFNKGAMLQKDLIKKTLKEDPSPERRASAAFLVGHFKDPREIISTLSASINDRSEVVRNNVMRVIGSTMLKANISDIELNPVLSLIDSPYTTDRNKALVILSEAVKSDKNKKIILKSGGEKLINLLRLKQPNNHDMAYLTLKRISGKNYSDKDIDSWQAWLKTQNV
ncbi:HEAT repeat domain-containing protein [Legionella sp. D16C41]|uniref:HEAT repeat domain-containing protein n=1 Tax=Legionella sp. D16C41 TaxID=3402688 RepID=UPI003AF86F26